ncbi:hypothetical protein [Nocardiopsis rhodophaea]|uniref:hypothetical protein n=1 Tax=Nocardiopsis rhodophaea TaxID=280238 RepID=UPI0031D23DCD
MFGRFPLRTLGVVGSTILLAAGCTAPSDPSSDPTEEPKETLIAADGPFIREGVFGEGTQFRARIEIDAVERHKDRTVLRYTTMPLQEGEHNARGGMDGGFQLLDPLGQRVYSQLPNSKHKAGAEADPESEEYTPRTLGNELPHTVMGGVEYVMEAHFPPLPKEAESITVLTPGTTGEFTGVAVTDLTEEEDDGEAPSSNEDGKEDDEVGDGGDEGGPTVRPGDVVTLPVVADPLPKKPGKYAKPLYRITENGKEQHDTTRTKERVTVRSEGLFRSGNGEGENKGGEKEKNDGRKNGAKLTEDGRYLFVGVGLDASEKIDPDEPLLTIVAHNSDEGKDDENLKKSQSQAAAVRDLLRENFGDEFQYKAEGRGSSQPIVEEKGAGKETARKRNQRVEISYKIVPEPIEELFGDEDDKSGQEGQRERDREESADGARDPDPADGATSKAQQPGDSGTADNPAPSPSTSVSPDDSPDDGESDEDGDQSGVTDTRPRPAPYRAEDATPVAAAEATIDEQSYRLEVLPFYRDGVYLVANFQITNKSPEEIDEEATPFADPTTYPGADFGSFVVVNPETGTAYHGLRIGQRNFLSDKGAEPTYLGPASYPYVTRTNSSNRVWMYIAAPPPWVTTVNFDAGAYGVIEDVPIE